jgi:hypothetical protein
MTSTSLSLERFFALADAYGGDLSRWPEADRAMARDLATASPDAQARLAEGRALDGALDLFQAAAPSAALRLRILAQAPKPRAISARAKLVRRLSWLGAAGALTCGVLAGATVVAVSAPSHIDADSLSGVYDQASGFDGAGVG